MSTPLVGVHVHKPGHTWLNELRKPDDLNYIFSLVLILSTRFYSFNDSDWIVPRLFMILIDCVKNLKENASKKATVLLALYTWKHVSIFELFLSHKCCWNFKLLHLKEKRTKKFLKFLNCVECDTETDYCKYKKTVIYHVFCSYALILIFLSLSFIFFFSFLLLIFEEKFGICYA